MIPKDHLHACPEHGVIAHKHDCPVCVTEAITDPKAVREENFGQIDLRWQVEPDTMLDLLPLLIEDAERAGEGPVKVAVAQISKSELAAGYTEQERWFNVPVVEVGNNSQMVIRHNGDAQEVIETLENGGEYVEAPEYDIDRLAPDYWLDIIEMFVGDANKDVDVEHPDDETIRFTVDVNNEVRHRQVYQELKSHAEIYDMSVYTRNAGGIFEDSVIEVSV